MEPNAIDLVVYLFGISIFILMIVLYLIWTDKDDVLIDNLETAVNDDELTLDNQKE